MVDGNSKKQRMMQSFRDFSTRAADHAGSVLADELGASRVEPVRVTRALQTAEQSFLTYETEQAGRVAML